MKIYIDDDYMCHTEDSSGRREIETDVFDGFCREYIEGFMLLPMGETWQREDGEVFTGEMVCPREAADKLEAVQRAVETAQAEDDAQMKVLLDIIYQSII